MKKKISEEKITCHGCEYCKIWYDEKEYTMRLSCAKTSKRGKCITWRSYPTFVAKGGRIVKSDDTIESITEKFIDYSKRRMAPYWCYKRKSNIKSKK